MTVATGIPSEWAGTEAPGFRSRSFALDAAFPDAPQLYLTGVVVVWKRVVLLSSRLARFVDTSS